VSAEVEVRMLEGSEFMIMNHDRCYRNSHFTYVYLELSSNEITCKSIT